LGELSTSEYEDVCPAWSVVFLLSTNSTITRQDTVLGGDSASCGSSSYQSTWGDYLDIDPGTYWVGACYDGGEEHAQVENSKGREEKPQPQDDDPSNDCSSGIQITVGDSAPDLAVVGIGFDRNTLKTGETIRLTAVIKNIGTATPHTSTVRVFLSTDINLTDIDPEIATTSLPALDGGEEWAGEGAIEVNVEPDDYHVIVCVDEVPNETDTFNNCGRASMMITVEADSDTACGGQAISCGDNVSGGLNSEDCTTGPQGPEHYAKKYTYSGNAGDTLWLDAEWGFDGYLFMESPQGLVVAENDNHTGVSNSHIEYTLEQSGEYVVWATSFAPDTSGSYELSVDCTGPSGPDLTVDTPAIDVRDLIPGQTMNVSARLRNEGNRSSDATTVRYVLSSDRLIDFSDPEMGSDGAVGLGPGNSTQQSVVLTAPATPGSYWVGACADVVPDESSSSNNCSAEQEIFVNSEPDCRNRSLSCGGLVSGTLSSADCLQSPRGSGFLAEVLEVDANRGDALVFDAHWSDLDGYLLLEDPTGVVVAENDDAGNSSRSRIEYKVEQGGIYRVWTTSYRRNGSGSYNLEMLCASASAPDLVASVVSASTSETNVNDSISLSAAVSNEGNGSANPTNVHFMLSNDEEITADDEVITSINMDSLAAGSSLNVEAFISAPDTPGNYWVGICVEQVQNETLTENNCSQIDDVPDSQNLQSANGDDNKLRTRALGDDGTLIQVSSGENCTLRNLSCGQNQSGILASNDCDKSPRGTGFLTDTFSFDGNAGDTVSLNVDWDDVDGYLYLEDPLGEVVGENDDYQGRTRSRLEYVLERTGTFRAWPTSFTQGQDQGGSYDVKLDCNSPAAPDLVVNQPEVSATSVRPGQNLSITTQVRNQGSGTSDSTSVQFILAADEHLSDTDRVLGMSDLSSLDEGDSSIESVSVPLNVTPGEYWIGSCVDADVEELDIDNNCEVTGPITVEENNQPIAINPGLNDAWFNEATGGQGFFINVFPDSDLMFLSWFTWDLERPPGSVPFQLGDPGHRWLTAQGNYELGVATLDVVLTHGGVFNAAEPEAQNDPDPYGTLTVSFSDCNHGEVVFDLPSVGESGTIPITRVSDNNVPVCEDYIGAAQTQSVARLEAEKSGIEAAEPGHRTEADSEAGSTLTYNQTLNDAWFSLDTSGQGFFFNVFPKQESAFVSWFTYDLDRPAENTPSELGEPGHRWLTAQGNFEGDTAQLKIYRHNGGVFNSGIPEPVGTEDGTLTAHFTDCNSGVVKFNIPSIGRQGEIAIQRLARDTIPACEQANKGEGTPESITPRNKQLLENLCGGDVDWHFDWPDDSRASAYWFELYRNDALSFTVNTLVKESDYDYMKSGAIPNEHRMDWKWRYKPFYVGPGRGDWSEFYTFDVKPENDPCL